MNEKPSNVRRTVYFSGRVQGVGFRATTASIARQFPVTGTVRNLADGRVELVAEGPPHALDQLLTAVREAMAGNIAHEAVQEAPASTAFESFRVIA